MFQLEYFVLRHIVAVSRYLFAAHEPFALSPHLSLTIPPKMHSPSRCRSSLVTLLLLNHRHRLGYFRRLNYGFPVNDAGTITKCTRSALTAYSIWTFILPPRHHEIQRRSCCLPQSSIAKRTRLPSLDSRTRLEFASRLSAARYYRRRCWNSHRKRRIRFLVQHP